MVPSHEARILEYYVIYFIIGVHKLEAYKLIAVLRLTRTVTKFLFPCYITSVHISLKLLTLQELQLSSRYCVI